MTKNSNDENWSHVRETVLMINVAVSRIEHAMVEGDDSFTKLSQSFVGIAHSANQIKQETQNLGDNPINKSIKTNCTEISNQIENSIITFQFYDRLSQRMALVSQTLNSLTDILSDPQKTHAQDEWKNLKKTIRSKYTLDADQELFDAVLSGASIQDAIKVAIEKTEGEDVEFF